ncbi:MAG: tetratricopeptide repeat protein, partial [Myxococcota bacterium]
MPVPFAALPSPSGEGGPWVVHHELVMISDARDLLPGAPTSAPTVPRVIGDPRIEDDAAQSFAPHPELAAVAEHAAELLGVESWLADQATTSAIADAPSPRVLVVATHGYALADGVGLLGAGATTAWNSAVPGLGWLDVAALARADLGGTELVDLSGCALPQGREVDTGLALARAARAAGARSVVVALGRATEAATVAFGEILHRALVDGQAPAQALRTAQIELSAQVSPLEWGAFTCVGDRSPTRPTTMAAASPGPSEVAFVEVLAAIVHVRAGAPDRALEACDRALAQDPRLAEVHFQRGQCLEALARYPEAVPAYREATRLEPADGAARYALAKLLLRGGQTDSGVEELTELGRQFPGDHFVWRDLVQIHRQAKDWGPARQCAERWLAVARDDDMAWHHYATILEAIDEPQKALVARERTVELAPDHALHWSNLGVHHARRGRFEQAELDLRKAVELDPAHAPSWRNLAQVRLELDRPADAESSARKAVEREPDHPAGHFLLGMTLKALDRLEEARPVLQ